MVAERPEGVGKVAATEAAVRAAARAAALVVVKAAAATEPYQAGAVGA